MTFEAWLTLAVIAVVIVALAREMVQPAAAVLGGTVILLLLGITTPEQAFAGFSNEAPIIIASLLVLARAVDLSGILQPVVGALFGSVTSTRALLARLLLPVTGSSGFLTNTTVVAMTVPPIIELSRRRALPPSRFLIPVSYAAVLGGVITTIGTSTNLTISGLLSRRPGMEPLELFEITPVGLPVALVGLAVVLLLGPRLLPDRGPRRADAIEGARDFTVSMRVQSGGPLDGQSVESGGLRQLHGVFLVEVERAGQVVAPVTPAEVLHGDDLLTFVGRVDDIVDLQRMRGLVSSESTHLEELGGAGHSFYEVVVGADLAGRTLKTVGFRARYNAAVLAVHRQGQRLEAKLGEVPLRLGDTLLVLADAGFRERWRDSRDFLLIAPLSGVAPTRSGKAPAVAAIAVVFVALTGLGLVSLLQGALLVVVGLIATRALTVNEARRAIDLNLVVLVAAAFGLGAAVEESGLGAAAAGGLLSLLAPFGLLAALAGVYIATVMLTELISNNAAAVLLFPVAVATAAGLGVDPRPFVIVVLFGASLAFMTPIGYQTNLMVYSLGNYRFLDFTRLGLPVTLLAGLTVVLLVPIFFPFRPA